jgi:hypothetical protein
VRDGRGPLKKTLRPIADAVEREVTEETIQIRIVKCPVLEDHRNMGVEGRPLIGAPYIVHPL